MYAVFLLLLHPQTFLLLPTCKASNSLISLSFFASQSTLDAILWWCWRHCHKLWPNGAIVSTWLNSLYPQTSSCFKLLLKYWLFEQWTSRMLVKVVVRRVLGLTHSSAGMRSEKVCTWSLFFTRVWTHNLGECQLLFYVSPHVEKCVKIDLS